MIDPSGVSSAPCGLSIRFSPFGQLYGTSRQSNHLELLFAWVSDQLQILPAVVLTDCDQFRSIAQDAAAVWYTLTYVVAPVCHQIGPVFLFFTYWRDAPGSPAACKCHGNDSKRMVVHRKTFQLLNYTSFVAEGSNLRMSGLNPAYMAPATRHVNGYVRRFQATVRICPPCRQPGRFQLSWRTHLRCSTDFSRCEIDVILPANLELL